MPEWSKGVDSSSTSASCVGSNPTGVIFDCLAVCLCFSVKRTIGKMGSKEESPFAPSGLSFFGTRWTSTSNCSRYRTVRLRFAPVRALAMCKCVWRIGDVRICFLFRNPMRRGLSRFTNIIDIVHLDGTTSGWTPTAWHPWSSGYDVSLTR